MCMDSAQCLKDCVRRRVKRREGAKGTSTTGRQGVDSEDGKVSIKAMDDGLLERLGRLNT